VGPHFKSSTYKFIVDAFLICLHHLVDLNMSTIQPKAIVNR